MAGSSVHSPLIFLTWPRPTEAKQTVAETAALIGVAFDARLPT